MRLRFTGRARRELHAQLDWLETRSQTAARRAAREIDDGLALLLDYPYAAPAVGKRDRELTIGFGHFGFVAQYRVLGDTVVILRIFRGGQAR